MNEIAKRHEVDDLPLWSDPAAHAMLCEKLATHGVDEEVFASLIAAYRGHAHKERKRGLLDDFDGIFLALEERL
ncbi:MAG: hypothetical protein Q8Q28_00615 [Pseudomonadota bacterium]|nr:hypothetical protein [Pseudomonadota bacterium]